MARKSAEVLESAARELAQVVLNRPYDPFVSPKDAEFFADAATVAAWIDYESDLTSPLQALADLITDTLTDAQALDLLRSERMQPIVKAAAVKYLVAEATDWVNDYEPSDREISRSYASSVDDPLIGDHRYYARAAR